MTLEILILRDPRESTKKCSLTSLREHERVRFVNYHPDRRLAADGYLLLHAEGEELTSADAGRPLLLLDCAWRRVAQLLGTVDGELVHRRLPRLTTAYPRRSTVFEDPEQGLASVEALFAASSILGEPSPSLLEGYRWAKEFVDANPSLAARPSR